MWEQSTFWPEEHLASLSPSPVNERDWMTRVAISPSSLLDLLIDSGPLGWCGRTSPVSCRLCVFGKPALSRILGLFPGGFAATTSG